MDDFIGQYENVLSQDECNNLIRYFEELKEVNSPLLYQRQNINDGARHQKDDESCYMDHSFLLSKHSGIFRGFIDEFQKIYVNLYEKKYSILKESAKLNIEHLKLQKTDIGGGYHLWHYENSTSITASRPITFMIYLNDVDEGGETEFLYLHKRFSPKRGRLLIWPSGFTHTHRGNPPLSNDKYIITGWLNYRE